MRLSKSNRARRRRCSTVFSGQPTGGRGGVCGGRNGRNKVFVSACHGASGNCGLLLVNLEIRSHLFGRFVGRCIIFSRPGESAHNSCVGGNFPATNSRGLVGT